MAWFFFLLHCVYARVTQWQSNETQQCINILDLYIWWILENALFQDHRITRLHILSGQPDLVGSCTHNKIELCSSIQRDPPVFLFVATAYCPITRHFWTEAGLVLAPPFQVFNHIDKIPSESSIPQNNEQPQLSQPFHTEEVYSAPFIICDPSLVSFWYIHVPPALVSPALESQIHCWNLSSNKGPLDLQANTFPVEIFQPCLYINIHKTECNWMIFQTFMVQYILC